LEHWNIGHSTFYVDHWNIGHLNIGHSTFYVDHWNIGQWNIGLWNIGHSTFYVESLIIGTLEHSYIGSWPWVEDRKDAQSMGSSAPEPIFTGLHQALSMD